MQKSFLWLMLMQFFWGINAFGQDISHLQGLGDTRYHRLQSELLERDFHIYIRLPESYETSENKKYPTAFLLDGGLTYPMFSGFYRYLSLAEEIPEMILVGISYGTSSFQDGNMRGTDFTAPSTEREYYGGASNFLNVLATELIPYIETSYRSDPEHRIIFGQSLGGQFVLFAALKSSLFWGHIASNPALHRNLAFFLPENHADLESSGQKLFVSSGSDDDERFRKPALAWMKAWSKKETVPWQLTTKTLDDQTHMSAAPTAFRNGVKWLFMAH